MELSMSKGTRQGQDQDQNQDRSLGIEPRREIELTAETFELRDLVGQLRRENQDYQLEAITLRQTLAELTHEMDLLSQNYNEYKNESPDKV